MSRRKSTQRSRGINANQSIHPRQSRSLFAARLLPSRKLRDISGRGATFPYPIYAKWADMYKKETGLSLNYQSIGSGGGIKQIKNEDRDVRSFRHAP